MLSDDPILVRWGLHDLLDGFSSTGVGRSSVQMNDVARTEFVQPGESYVIRGFSSVGNDEVIAQALQEELSQVAAKEAVEGQPVEGPVVSQDWQSWPAPRSDNWEFGAAAQNAEYDSSPNDNDESGEDSDDGGAPELPERFGTYDREVGKRLTHMDSIPHVPRINGDIPTFDNASAAHQRLLDRLKHYGLTELKVDGDGNCQFRAFSDQLYRTPSYHKSVREDIVKQLRSHPAVYDGYIPMTYDEYLKKMAKCGEWGDHVTLQAGADYYGVRICLLTSFKDKSFIEILPRMSNSQRVIFLSFWSEVHYNSVYPEGDVPVHSRRTKRRHLRQYLKSKLKM